MRYISSPMPSSTSAIVLVSGGLDSCVAAAVASADCELSFLHVNYGQRTEARELTAFEHIADHYGVNRRLIVDIGYLRQIGGSSLVDPDAEIPETADVPGMPSTYVPFRNANLLSIAVSWAEAIGAVDIFIGAHERQSPYPDCRAEFFEAFNRAISAGTAVQRPVVVRAPLIELDKPAIIRRGTDLGAPLHLTWSCYRSQTAACGRCHSCELRQHGFRRAGILDPLRIESDC